MTLQTVRNATLIAVVVGAVGTVGVLIAMNLMTFGGGLPWAGVSGFALWTLVPYVMLYGGVRWLVRGMGTAIVVLIASLATAGSGLWYYLDAYFLHLGWTSGLAYLFVPYGQVIAVAITFGLTAAIGLPGERRHRQAAF